MAKKDKTKKHDEIEDIYEEFDPPTRKSKKQKRKSRMRVHGRDLKRNYNYQED